MSDKAANYNNRHILTERKNIRAPFHNYSGGIYFVTICTADKEHFFGEIRNGEMTYTPIGAEAFRCMKTLASHYSYVEVPIFVVMPNHVHAIIVIREQAAAPGCSPTGRAVADEREQAAAPGCSPTGRAVADEREQAAAPGCSPTGRAVADEREQAAAPGCIPKIRTALGVVVGGYKQAVTRFARRNSIEFGWQARYNDHIIRGACDEHNISCYIKNNVALWTNDCLNH